MSWSNLQNKPKGAQLSIDGFYRTIENESKLNQEVDKLFSSELGIKSIRLFKVYNNRCSSW